ncbi:MAG TPA: sodium:solute symporter [Candidatus Saccharimonadaceae bacterium]|jgi:Na+/proline symporter|nr:sodium:solute symporter [Candidatus Saccharimonadaceae bacterium]
MSALDWIVLGAALVGFIAYGAWRGRGSHGLESYVLADRALPWGMVALSVMATQASATTFLATPGQAYVDGLRFVQFYFGLPLAMVALSVTLVPLFHRLHVYTAYEYLERRFDGNTRTLTAVLFLVQRGLAAGITIFAPALILSVLLGWNLHATCLALGAVVVAYTAAGGARAVGHSHTLQFLIILGAMAVAFALTVLRLPHGVGFGDAVGLAGHLGKLHAVDTHFDPTSRYTLWSGLIGGFFLQMSYFGTDQSQVGRYLTGRSIAHSKMGLLANGLVKVPMQFAILFLGVMVFAFHQLEPPALWADPVTAAHVARVATGDWRALETRWRDATGARAEAARDRVGAARAHDAAALAAADAALDASVQRCAAVRADAAALIRARDPHANPSDTNYIFLGFVLAHLPAGVIGLVLAAIFAAAMNSISSELNALSSTTVVDVLRRLPSWPGGERAELIASRVATMLWAALAVGFAENASRLGSLVEAVNLLGSLFYGTILGIFLTAFYCRHVGGRAVFTAALIGEAAVLACFKLTTVSFLWYNVVGCLGVIGVALALEPIVGRRGAATARA